MMMKVNAYHRVGLLHVLLSSVYDLDYNLFSCVTLCVFSTSCYSHADHNAAITVNSVKTEITQ